MGNTLDGAGEPVESIIKSIKDWEWTVVDDRYGVVLGLYDFDLTLVFRKDSKGGLFGDTAMNWMTPAELRCLTDFVAEWLPHYHRNRFMQLVKE